MRYDCDCLPLVEHLDAEHRHLREVMLQMQATIDAGVQSRSDAEAIERQLVALRDELERHYAEEERGGCLEEAASRCPSLSGDVTRVIAEHQELRADMDAIVGQSRLVVDNLAELPGLQQSFAEFARHRREIQTFGLAAQLYALNGSCHLNTPERRLGPF